MGNAGCCARMRAQRGGQPRKPLRLDCSRHLGSVGTVRALPPSEPEHEEPMPTTSDRRSDLKRVRISNRVRASVSSDGLVLLDLHDGLVLAANGVGAHIWRLIEAQLDSAAIVRHIAEDYGVPLERAERDVAAFLAALESRGLVAREPAC